MKPYQSCRVLSLIDSRYTIKDQPSLLEIPLRNKIHAWASSSLVGERTYRSVLRPLLKQPAPSSSSTPTPNIDTKSHPRSTTRMDPHYDWYEALQRGEVDIFGDAPPTRPPTSRRRRRPRTQLTPAKKITYGSTYQQSAATTHFNKRIIEKCGELEVNVPGRPPRRDHVSADVGQAVPPLDTSARNKVCDASTPERGSGPGKRSIKGLDSNDDSEDLSVPGPKQRRIDSPQTSVPGEEDIATPDGADNESDDEMLPVGDTEDVPNKQPSIAAPTPRVQRTSSIFRPTVLVNLAGALPIPFGDKPFRSAATTKMIKWTGSKHAYHRKCVLFLLGHSNKCGLPYRGVKTVFTHIFCRYLNSLSEEPPAQKFASQLGMHTYVDKPRHSDWDELLGLLPVVGWKQQCVSDCEKAVQLALSQLGMQAKTPSPCAACAAWPAEVARKKAEKQDRSE